MLTASSPWRASIACAAASAIAGAGCNAIVGFDDLKKVEVLPTGATADKLSVGGEHTCAIMVDRTVRCWGANNVGQLGVGDRATHTRPTIVPGLNQVDFLTVGGTHTCAVKSGGAVYCWGGNASGQLGLGDTTPRDKPTLVSGAEAAEKIQAGLAHTCSELRDKTVQCWGANDVGQLGMGTNTPMETSPQKLAGLTGVAKLSIGGGNHSCAVALDSTRTANVVYCWGANDREQLGMPNTTPSSPTPTVVPGLVAASKTYVGRSHSCATFDGDTSVQCWGDNEFGQLGDGTTLSRAFPKKVEGLEVAISLGVGFRHTCAFESEIAVKCWGANDFGQLGYATSGNTPKSSPGDVPLPVRDKVRDGSAKAEHACAITSKNEVYCWGANGKGQLGDGTTQNKFTPTRILFL